MKGRLAIGEHGNTEAKIQKLILCERYKLLRSFGWKKRTTDMTKNCG